MDYVEKIIKDSTFSFGGDIFKRNKSKDTTEIIERLNEVSDNMVFLFWDVFYEVAENNNSGLEYISGNSRNDLPLGNMKLSQ